MSKKSKSCACSDEFGMGNNCYLWILILLSSGGNNGLGNMLGLGNNPTSTIILLMLLCGYGNN